MGVRVDDYNAVKVFTATLQRDRAGLGEAITRWIVEDRSVIVKEVVTQSSDEEFHCLSITFFYRRAQ